jgi:hypothetical protein
VTDQAEGEGVSMNERLLSCEDLLNITGYKNIGDLARSLSKQGIRFFYGKGGAIWTTVNLVDAAGGLKPLVNENDAPKLEDSL